MNFKRKLLIIFLSFFLPINTFAYSKYLIPGGDSIGITIKSDGVFIVGFYDVDGMNPANYGLKIGDRIVSINDKKINSVSSLVDEVNSTDENIQIKIGYIRNNQVNYVNLDLKKDKNGIYKTGIYVKDTITGIGTLTYINPSDNTYGALGHEIIDSKTGTNFTLLNGKIYESSITSITKSFNGTTGEKNAKLYQNKVLGSVNYNIETGIFGKMDKINDSEKVEIKELDEVKIGKAEIVTVLSDNNKEHFDIEILSIDNSNDVKNFYIKVTDKRLLDKTGGIVKGMSGSPILQDGKIIGAITHALVDDPKRGYGIGITKMLESLE